MNNSNFNHDVVVVKICKELHMDVDLVRAIITAESNWCERVTRYEPHWRYWYKTDFFSRINVPMITEQTETIHQATSWGLMQIMGSVARELGFNGYLTELIEPEKNIYFGCQQLIRLSKSAYTTDDLIASYNAGSAIRSKTGKYINQDYVDKVSAIWKKLKQQKLGNLTS